jgi:pimeloyl-ACP methyl ester carboxylesterase
MKIVDQGTGPPLLLIPGLQGRWEYVRPTVQALAKVCRVITFTLCDERSAGAPYDRAAGLDSFVEQARAALDQCNLSRAAVCGVSFGGIVALRFAAQHSNRTSALLLVSTPGPHWSLRRKHQIYARAPWLFGPVFLAEAPWRLWHEIALALPDGAARRRFVRDQLRTLFQAPLSLSRMAARARLIGESQRASDCLRVVAPTLVVHGEPQLDHVVPVEGTSDYGRLIRGAQTVLLERTGHLGTLTHPDAFARVVGAFLEENSIDRQGSAGAAGRPAVA